MSSNIAYCRHRRLHQCLRPRAREQAREPATDERPRQLQRRAEGSSATLDPILAQQEHAVEKGGGAPAGRGGAARHVYAPAPTRRCLWA